MFGYIRPYKPYMRMYEYEIYKSVYCGLCKDMKERCGYFTRFSLSYDFTFLALMDLAVNEKNIRLEKRRCPVHPISKTSCLCQTSDCSYSSLSAVILTYHKLRDDISDKGLKGKLLAAITLPFFGKPYRKAKKELPHLTVTAEKAMKIQNDIERNGCCGIDQACQPTADMMSEAFGGLCDTASTRNTLRRFGYLLGRFVYICDALDDLSDDSKDGNFNPLKELFGIPDGTENIPKDTLKKVYEYTDMTINFTLGELAESYVKLDIKLYKDILDNIIYLGLKNVYKSIKNGKFRKKKGKKDNV